MTYYSITIMKPIHCISLLLLSVTLLLGSCQKSDDPAEDPVFRINGTLNSGGRERTYLLNLPPNYYQQSGFSLLIAMHGGGGEALQFEASSRLTEKANESSFVVVYPEGVKSTGLLEARTWNAGACCDYARDHNIDDVGFITALIDELGRKYKINLKKVYATGHSNGGMLTYRLACERSGKIAAIAPNGCTMVAPVCNPTRAVPILHMHSVLDTKVPYQGGFGTGVGTDAVHCPSLDSVLNVWAQKNGCAAPAQIIVNNNQYKFTSWTGCTAGTAINYYLTQDGGHAWPGGLPGSSNGDTPSTVIDANDLLWDFFQQFELP